MTGPLYHKATIVGEIRLIDEMQWEALVGSATPVLHDTVVTVVMH
jgi:hypothetical protein